MREIKFRAWDKKIQQFIDAKEIVINDGKVFRNWQDYEDYIPDDNTIELVWFTGLKDKNGVEIYEGDIIGLDGFWSYCIDFHDGAFRKIPCNQAQKLNWPWNPLEKVTIEVHGWEVIGNRYENPELLEEEPTC